MSSRTFLALEIDTDVQRRLAGSATRVDLAGARALFVRAIEAAPEDTLLKANLNLLGAAGHPATGKQELRAQMSGKVVKILVDVGQQVDIDQDLVVIESMKMENELRSPIRGVVTKVAIEEGVAVETGALLIVIEPTGTR